ATRCRTRPRRRRAPPFPCGRVSLRSQLSRGRGRLGRRSQCPLSRMEFANRRRRPPAACPPSRSWNSPSRSWYSPKRTFGRDFVTYSPRLTVRYTGMRGEAVFALDTERAALRLRLAAAALATTLVLLAGERATALAAATIPIYLAGAVVLRYGRMGRLPVARSLVGSALDVVTATATVFSLPLDSPTLLLAAPSRAAVTAVATVSSLPLDPPTWTLYAFAIATTALWRRPLGVFGATAASILAYDLTLGLRTGEAPVSALWVVQALIAVGLISAELVYSAVRATADRERMRRHGHALRAFAEAKGTQALLDTLRSQILALGAVHVRVGTDQVALQESLAGRPGFV